MIKMTNPIVEKNLERLVGDKDGDLLFALKNDQESIGGTCLEGYPCMGANFFYDGKTGEIKLFDNYTPFDKLRANHWEGEPLRGTFRMALDIRMMPFRGSSRKRIIEYFIDSNTSEIAKHNLKETVRVYNERYGFKPDVAEELIKVKCHLIIDEQIQKIVLAQMNRIT